LFTLAAIGRDSSWTWEKTCREGIRDAASSQGGLSRSQQTERGKSESGMSFYS